MAQVSPRPPPSNEAGEDNLLPDFENFPAHDKSYGCQEVPVDIDDPRLMSLGAPEQTRKADHSGHSADKTDAFDDGMLLTRPNFASFRAQEPGRDFNYGPATAISAANFTKSSHRPALIQSYKDQAEDNVQGQKSQVFVPRNKTNPSPLAENSESVVERPQAKITEGLPSLNHIQKPSTPPQITQHQVNGIIGAPSKPRKDASVSATSPPFQDPSPAPSVQHSVRSRTAEVPFNHETQLREQPTLPRHHNLEAGARKTQSNTRGDLPGPREQLSRQGGSHNLLLPFAEEEQDGPHENEFGRKDFVGLRASRHAPFNDTNISREHPVPHTTHTKAPTKSTDIARHSKTILVKHGPRPLSRSSNVSRRRAAPQKNPTSHMSELPSEFRSDSVAPSPEARDNTLAINDFTSNMANVINHYTQHHKSALDKQMAKYDRYIKRLKYERSQGKKELEKCASQIEAQAHTIQEFQIRETSMGDQIKLLEKEAASSEARIQQIEDKYYMCKGFLNSAIEEQQRLYNQSKKHCEDSVVEIRAMEKDHKASMELAVEKAETARAQMLEKVKKVIAEANVEEQGLRKQIKSAHQQLEQKTAELEREQDANRVLSQRLQSMKTETNGLEDLAVQNKEILEKLDEQYTATIEKSRQVEQETQAKFDEVNQGIKGLLKLLSGQPLEFINIQNSHKELADCITAKANEMSWGQHASEESTRKFFTDIETLVKQVLEHLNQKNQDTSQELSKMTEECGGLALLVKVEEARCQELEAEIDAMKEEAEKRESEIQELDEKLFHFQATDMDLRDARQQVLSVQTEKQRLEGEVHSKETEIKRLEEMLREKNEAHTLELSKFTTNLTKLNQMLRDKEDASRVAVDKVTELVRSEMRIETEKADAEAKKTLRLAEKERDALAADVERLKQDLGINEDRSSRDAQTINSLRNTLAAAEERLENLADEAKQSAADLEKLQAQEIATVKAFEERISSVEETAAGRGEETRHLLVTIQQFVTALKKWSEWGPLPVEVKRVLSDLEVSPSSDEEPDARLSEIFQKITAVIRDQQPPAPAAEIPIQDDGSSRFFPKDNSNLPELRSSEQSEIGGAGNMRLRARGQQPGSFGYPNGQSLGPTQLFMNDQIRRVEVRSPALGLQEEPSPPSVDQEKTMRREAQQPRPIMKRSSQSDDRAESMDLVDETSQGMFTRRVDQDQPQGPVASGQQQGARISAGQQEPGKADRQQKGKKGAGRAAPKHATKAPQKSHGSTVPSKRRRDPEASKIGSTGRRLVRIQRPSLNEQSQRSLLSQPLPAGDGFGSPHSMDYGLSPPDSQNVSQLSLGGGLASQSQGLTRTGRTYGSRKAQEDSLRTEQSLGNLRSRLGIWEGPDDDDALASTRDARQKRARIESQDAGLSPSAPSLMFPNLPPRKVTTR